MSKTTFKIEISSRAHPGMTFSTTAHAVVKTGRGYVDQEAFIDAAVSVTVGFDSLGAKLKGMGIDENFCRVESISIDDDGSALKKFSIGMTDGSARSVFAPDHARASLLAALKRAYEGKSNLPALSNDMPGHVDDFVSRAPDNSAAEGVYCEFQVQDWRVRELSDEELTDAQKAPMTFSIVDYGYGPAAIFKAADAEYAIAMEIDRGCVVARASPAEDENARADIRLGRNEAQVLMTTGDKNMTFAVSEKGIEREDEGKLLTQDGDDVLEPSI